jgi:hypothetical protein
MLRRSMRSFITLILLACTGCTAETEVVSLPRAEPVAALPTAETFLVAVCDLYRTSPCCGRVYDGRGACSATYLPQLGAVVFDARAADECLSKLRQTSCDAYQAVESSGACARVFSGVRAEGRACARHSDCASTSEGVGVCQRIDRYEQGGRCGIAASLPTVPPERWLRDRCPFLGD